MDRRAALLAGAVAVLAFAASAAYALDAPRTLDERIVAWVAEHRVTGLTNLAELLAVLGSWIVVTPLAVLAVAVLLGVGRRRAALFVGFCVAVEAVLNPMLKSMFGLARPDPDLAVTQVSGLGFPSGHAMAAAAFSLALALLAWPTRWRRPALAAAVAWTLLMGWSRVYLGVHWPSDVVGGWAAGVAVALGVCAVVGLGARAEPAEATVRVVLFDWGNTLMVDDGQTGPMAAWPRVAAVPGAAEALAALHGRNRLCVATNADDSGADEVMAALGRVGLARFVDRVFSSHDIGARKPDPAFYAAVLDALRADAAARGEPDLRADQVLMVGDNYENDVTAAASAGLRAVWFNPRGQPVPGDPPHEARNRVAEIRTLTDLPAAV
jgi:membrane-associated phospholipid phosphatase